MYCLHAGRENGILKWCMRWVLEDVLNPQRRSCTYGCTLNMNWMGLRSFKMKRGLFKTWFFLKSLKKMNKIHIHTSIIAVMISIQLKNNISGVTLMVKQKQIQLGTIRLWVWSLAWLSRLRIKCCHELWCRSEKWLRSVVAVPLA